ncbi:MAG: hypothetical protein Q9219_003561 [cf. Caloplaca sp. 3 TL-2023]
MASEVLSQIQTNVGYFERRQRGDSATGWLKWNSADWLKDGVQLAGVALQRPSLYPNQIPQAFGIGDAAYAADGGQLGFVYKRNFTFGLASPQFPSDGGAWAAGVDPALSWVKAGTDEFVPGTDGGDLRAIACAVNLFGQNDIFKADFNGLCWRGTYLPSGRGFPTPPSFAQCKIEFATNGAPGTKKRSLGKFNGYDVLSIEMLDDVEDSE